MPIYFKGVGPGTYWAANSPSSGFTAENPGTGHSDNRLIQHVVYGNTNSPYISMTASYAVAACYASNGPGGIATPTNKGIVYEIEFPDPAPPGVTLIDPVQELINSSPGPPNTINHHHDGGQDLLKGIIDNATYGHCLIDPPDRLGRNPNTSPPIVTDQLKCLVMALRDTEILAMGVIPRAQIVGQHDVPQITI